MRLAILGATGRIGRHVLEQATESGHDVRVLVRNPDRLGPLATRVEAVVGCVDDPEAVDRVIGGADVVISAVGPDRNTADQVDRLRTGMEATVAAMRRHGVRRIVNLSGAGISAAGDRKPFIDRIVTRIVRRLARHVVGAKQAEYDVLAASNLEWVAVRPALVTDGQLTARYVAGPDALRPGARISRADIAHLMLAQAVEPTHVGHPGVFVRAR